jgi:hypothetical protein
MKILSLGWGVQSFTLAAMVAMGEIEPIDYAIHADTTHEASWTYDFANKWMPWLEERGIKIITVNPSGYLLNPLDYKSTNSILIPMFTDTLTAKGGRLRRQCTDKWKISPIRRWIQSHRKSEQVKLWIGISWDEALRMRQSDVSYITNQWPLIENRVTRQDCVEWLRGHGLEVPNKSSCIFCPFHDNKTWRKIKMSGNGDWEKAVAMDYALREAKPPYKLYLHSSRKPLDKIDYRSEIDRGQLSLWDEECTGLCGV